MALCRGSSDFQRNTMKCHSIQFCSSEDEILSERVMVMLTATCWYFRMKNLMDVLSTLLHQSFKQPSLFTLMPLLNPLRPPRSTLPFSIPPTQSMQRQQPLQMWGGSDDLDRTSCQRDKISWREEMTQYCEIFRVTKICSYLFLSCTV